MTDFFRPHSIQDIEKSIGNTRAYYLAGGTDIMVLKKDFELDENLPWVDLSGLAELQGIEYKNNAIDIGACTTMSELEGSELVREFAPAISEAAASVGSPLIRNLATIAGNIANSNPAGDIIPAVYAHDATLVLQKGGEINEVKVNDFCTGPCSNTLKEGEIITRIKIPVKEGSSSSFMKIGARRSLAIAKVSCVVWLTRDGKIIEDIRIAMGAVGPKCVRAREAEKFLKIKYINTEILDEAAELVQTGMCPIDDFRSTVKYRRDTGAVLFKRLVNKLMK